MTPERQRPKDFERRLIVKLVKTGLFRQKPKEPPEIFVREFTDFLYYKSLDDIYATVKMLELKQDRMLSQFEREQAINKAKEEIREKLRGKWVPVRNKICQSKILEKLKKGEYDHYRDTLIIVGGITQFFSDQPILTTFAIASATLKIATHNVDRFCTKAGLNFDEMEKAAKKPETEHNH